MKSAAPIVPIFALPSARRLENWRILSQLVPILTQQGLAVAVVRILTEGEEGAVGPVDGQGLGEIALIQLGPTDYGRESAGWMPLLASLASQYDCLFVDGAPAGGEASTGWVASAPAGETIPAWYGLASAGHWHGSAAQIVDQLQIRLKEMPVWACVLIGGKSSRMGRPKHLLPTPTGQSWLEKTLTTIQPLVDDLVISGAGTVPASLAGLRRIPDLPGLAGPLTGILAAMRWQPEVSWLLLACDLPDLSADALSWLLAERRPACWATIPHHAHTDRPEPLLAWYDPRCRQLFEQLKTAGIAKISTVVASGKVHQPVIPTKLRPAWRNVNRPEDLAVAAHGD